MPSWPVLGAVSCRGTSTTPKEHFLVLSLAHHILSAKEKASHRALAGGFTRSRQTDVSRLSFLAFACLCSAGQPAWNFLEQVPFFEVGKPCCGIARKAVCKRRASSPSDTFSHSSVAALSRGRNAFTAINFHSSYPKYNQFPLQHFDTEFQTTHLEWRVARAFLGMHPRLCSGFLESHSALVITCLQVPEVFVLLSRNSR